MTRLRNEYFVADGPFAGGKLLWSCVLIPGETTAMIPFKLAAWTNSPGNMQLPLDGAAGHFLCWYEMTGDGMLRFTGRVTWSAKDVP